MHLKINYAVHALHGPVVTMPRVLVTTICSLFPWCMLPLVKEVRGGVGGSLNHDGVSTLDYPVVYSVT